MQRKNSVDRFGWVPKVGWFEFRMGSTSQQRIPNLVAFL